MTRIRQNGFSPQLFSVFKPHAFCASIVYKDFRYRSVSADCCAMCFCRCSESKADTTHATSNVAPHTLLSVHLPEHVMPEDVDRAGRLGSNKGTDHTLSCIGSSKIMGFKIVGQHIIKIAKHQIAINFLIFTPKACREIGHTWRLFKQ